MADLRSVWEIYVSALNAKTRDDKLAVLARCARADVAYDDPLVATQGAEALVDYMLSFESINPGGRFETVDFLAHHDQSLSRWNVVSAEGNKVGEGSSYATYDKADGKLVKVAVFFVS